MNENGKMNENQNAANPQPGTFLGELEVQLKAIADMTERFAADKTRTVSFLAIAIEEVDGAEGYNQIIAMNGSKGAIVKGLSNFANNAETCGLMVVALKNALFEKCLDGLMNIMKD